MEQKDDKPPSASSSNSAPKLFTILVNRKRQLSSNRQHEPQNPNLQHRVPPVFNDDGTPQKPGSSRMSVFSPSQDEDAVNTPPRHKTKRRASDSHTSLTPGISQLQPSQAKKSRPSTDSDRVVSKHLLKSPVKVLKNEASADVEMDAKEVFAKSPGSPSSECKAMMDEIDVSPELDVDDFLKRQSKRNMRKCKSLELRRRLNDMTNTPPNCHKKSLFKVPIPVSETLRVRALEQRDAAGAGTSSQTPSNGSETDSYPETAAHVRIKEAVDVLMTQGLIADGSRHYCLPLVKGKADLQTIDHNTMADLLSDHHATKFDKYTVIDCRYPYEYNGGHIKGALNIYTEEAMSDFLNSYFEESAKVSPPSHHILVFHCEFSSQRGPSMMRHLRKSDRQLNLCHYPQLAFPEIYCLYGGYKEFFAHHPDLCEPCEYIPMLDDKYSAELKFYRSKTSDMRMLRAKAKSWAGERVKMRLPSEDVDEW